ncbi:hypothetical protein POVWA2_005800 [Plasmodium ovale wallikeri]|uniref:Uncharacterized protein n=1 Tax=Plasmodium ovale wallikeri TaxID=864142 RepID=A0A1A8YIL5_PLAOA|nr:hypothetical protein POVWA1_005710 [Plasmodium ovale wallikeri]SBT31745.1 hypothetical protein POVWA2_005800 [Plasmodium ovale wallikeri]
MGTENSVRTYLFKIVENVFNTFVARSQKKGGPIREDPSKGEEPFKGEDPLKGENPAKSTKLGLIKSEREYFPIFGTLIGFYFDSGRIVRFDEVLAVFLASFLHVQPPQTFASGPFTTYSL